MKAKFTEAAGGIHYEEVSHPRPYQRIPILTPPITAIADIDYGKLPDTVQLIRIREFLLHGKDEEGALDYREIVK